MRIVFLGTLGWFSTDLGRTSCVLVDSEEYHIILDAGGGIHRLDEYINFEKRAYMFLSHLHLDHIVGLHVLGKFRFKQTLSIYGYEGTREGLRIIRHPYTAPFSSLPFKTEIQELTEGRHCLPFPVTCRLLLHSDPCLGYRIEIDDKVVAYCTDTGICENLYELAANADLLITECSLRPGQKSRIWPHLNPEEAAEMAKRANVKQLVLTHFDAYHYRTVEERKEAEAVSKNIFENTVAAYDGFEIEI